MTDQEIRIAVAEIAGWKGPKHPDVLAKMEGWWSRERRVWWMDPAGKFTMISSVPDYPNDANAVHALEKLLLKDRDTQIKYAWILWRLASADDVWLDDDWEMVYDHSTSNLFDVALASPRQRCIAMLKAHGKWRE